MISNIEYKHNNQEILSLTNSYGLKMEIGQKLSRGVITQFFDGRSYSGNLQNLRVAGSIHVFIKEENGDIKKWDVDGFIPCPSIRRRTLLILKK